MSDVLEPERESANGLLDYEQAAACLSVTLKHWVCARKITYARIGSLARFRKSDHGADFA